MGRLVRLGRLTAGTGLPRREVQNSAHSTSLARESGAEKIEKFSARFDLTLDTLPWPLSHKGRGKSASLARRVGVSPGRSQA